MDLSHENSLSPEPQNIHFSPPLDPDRTEMHTSMERIEELLHFGQNLLYGDENHLASTTLEGSHLNERQVEFLPVKGRARVKRAARSPMARVPLQRTPQQRPRNPLHQQSRGYQNGDGAVYSKQNPQGASHVKPGEHRNARLALLQWPKPLPKGMREYNDGEKENVSLEELEQRIRDELTEYRRRRNAKHPHQQFHPYDGYDKHGISPLPSKRYATSSATPPRHYSNNRAARSTSQESPSHVHPSRSIRSRSGGASSVTALRHREKSMTGTDGHFSSSSNTGLGDSKWRQREHLPAWKRLYESAPKPTEKQRKVAVIRREDSERKASRKPSLMGSKNFSRQNSPQGTNFTPNRSGNTQTNGSNSITTVLAYADNRSNASDSLMGHRLQKKLGSPVPKRDMTSHSTTGNTQQTKGVRMGSSSLSVNQRPMSKNLMMGKNALRKQPRDVKQATGKVGTHVNETKKPQEPTSATGIADQHREMNSTGDGEIEKTENSHESLGKLYIPVNQNSSSISKQLSTNQNEFGAGEDAAFQGSWFSQPDGSSTLPPAVSPLDLRALKM